MKVFDLELKVVQSYKEKTGYTNLLLRCVGANSCIYVWSELVFSVGPALGWIFLLNHVYWNLCNIGFQNVFDHEMIDFEAFSIETCIVLF